MSEVSITPSAIIVGLSDPSKGRTLILRNRHDLPSCPFDHKIAAKHNWVTASARIQNTNIRLKVSPDVELWGSIKEIESYWLVLGYYILEVLGMLWEFLSMIKTKECTTHWFHWSCIDSSYELVQNGQYRVMRRTWASEGRHIDWLRRELSAAAMIIWTSG